LALDLGASGGRAILGSLDGQRLRLTALHRFPNGPMRILEHLYWDAPGLFREIKTALSRCAARDVVLDGIGIDTWGVDYGLLSADGALLGLPHHYRDGRTRGMFAKAFHRVPREEIYARTGIQFLEFNTLYQLLAHACGLDCELLDTTATLLLMPDLFRYWLTGSRQSEHTIASTSQLYDVAAGCWDLDLCARLGLPTGCLPPIVPPGTVVSPLATAIQEECGCGPCDVIATASHDTAAAVAAVPACGDDWAYISSGTWSLVGVELPAPLRTTEALAANVTNEGGVGGTVRLLKNVAGLWLVQECQRAWQQAGQPFSFEQLVALATSTPRGQYFVDPDDECFVEPGDMPRRIQASCAERGQPVPQTPGEIVRCILESLALKYRFVVEQLERLTGRALRVIHVVGGGARNKLLGQLTADVTGRPVIAGPAEATAVGNILVQALAHGRINSLADIRRVVAQSTRLRRYQPRDTQVWDGIRPPCAGRSGA
jgi:rhamnulokinase